MNPDPETWNIPEEEYRNIFESIKEALVIYHLDNGMIANLNPAACELFDYSRNELIGQDPVLLMTPETYALFRKDIENLEPDNVVESLAVFLRKTGSEFYAEVRRSRINYQGRPCLLSAIRDVNQRILTDKKLSEQIEARRREQATLLAISHTLASTLELQPGLILDQLREIIAYTHGGLFALEGTRLVSLSMRGTRALEQSAPFQIQLQDPETLVALFNEHRPIRIADVWGDEPQAQFLRVLLNGRTAGLLDGMRSWMWVPLAVKGRVIGGVGIAETRKNYFTAHHADLALSVADQAAITMINAELYEHAQALAVLEERQRLARNLHDAVNQSLFSAGLIAEVLPRLWDRDQAEARRSLEDLRRLTRGAQAEMRALLAELRPSTLTDSSLSDLLKLLGNAFTGRTNMQVEMKVDGETSLPADVQIAIYRISQEALNNIVKHARASRVEIELNQAPGMLELHIRDDGRGFDTGTASASGHYGLGMMHERAEGVGAALQVISQPGHGTELTIHWTGTLLKETV